MTAPVEVQAINIGGGRQVSLNEALDLIGEATGRHLPDRAPRAAPGRPTPGPTARGARRCSATAPRSTWRPGWPRR